MKSNNMYISATLMVSWIIGAAIVAACLWIYPSPELRETMVLRLGLGTFMMIFATTCLHYVDSVLDGWWAEKVGENAYASAAVYIAVLFLVGSSMRLFQ